MDIDTLVRFTTQGMLLCMYISLPIVIVAALVGLGVSFLQAITSMQDQTLSHGVKLIAVTVAIVIAAPFSAAA
ncbi:type III secretion system export apparatus subunit SctS, partial [Paraburkholderia sp. SIMBA_053]